MRICLTDKRDTIDRGDVVHYFCKNCGCEMYAELGSSHSKEQKKRVSLFMRMQSCPHCKERLVHTAGYYYFTYYNEATNVKDNASWFRDKDIEVYKTYNVEKSFKRMQKLRASQEQQLVENAVEELCKKCTSSNEISSISSFVDKVKGNSSKLKEYLHNVIKIETNIHSLSKRLEALYLQRIVIDRHNESIKFTYIRRMDKPLEEAQKQYQSCLDEYSKLKSKKPEKVTIKMPKEPTPPILEKAGLFNKKKVLERNEFLTAQYEEALIKYKQQIEACEQEKNKLEEEKAQELALSVANAHKKVEEAKRELGQAKFNAENCSVVPEQIMAPLVLSKSIIEKEIEEAEELLRKLLQCRRELYGYNVIFSKYQNLVAVATFYEYLMAGRCELLEGANGAYNLYETEIRANLIIGQLSQVIESLEQVKGNQYMIYSELKNINQNIEVLNSTMNSALQTLRKISYSAEKMENHLENISENTEKIAQNTSVIAYNSEVTAYYSKLNAELTNSLGYLVAFK